MNESNATDLYVVKGSVFRMGFAIISVVRMRVPEVTVYKIDNVWSVGLGSLSFDVHEGLMEEVTSLRVARAYWREKMFANAHC